MSLNVYDNVICTEEPQRGDKVEMVVAIYESLDAVRGHEPDTETPEDSSTKRILRTQHLDSNTAGIRCYRLAAVCLGLLCVLLLTFITVRWITFNNLITERDQLKTNCTVLTIERDQLQTRYTNLTIERDQLQTRYTNLTIERDQLQTRYTNLTIERDQLQTRYTNLTIERDQLQTSYTSLTIERDQLQTSYTSLTVERDQFQAERGRLQRRLSELERDINKPGWIYFSSSIYYISTRKTSWYGSRQDCRKRGADLVAIRSKEEQDFIEKLRRGQTAWIGLRKQETKGIWNWVDGSRLTTSFWGRGEPTGHGQCVMIGHWSDPVNNWADYACDNSFVWICEKRIFS